MRLPLHVTVACALALVGSVCCARAENEKHGRASAVLTGSIRPALTGKERLGPKWSDEQRIDNCRVPIDKRGSKPRPSACSNGPSS